MPRKKEPSSTTGNDPIARQLTALIRERDITQITLADALGGIQRQTVSNYANGQSVPDAYTLGKIADYFGVSTDYLLNPERPRTPDTSLQAICEKTRLSEDAAGKIIGLRSDTVSVLSKAIESKSFIRFLDLLEEAKEESIEVYGLLDYLIEADQKRAEDPDGYETLVDTLRFRTRELRGLKYDVMESAVRMLNDMMQADCGFSYDTVVEETESFVSVYYKTIAEKEQEVHDGVDHEKDK